ncbi:MAG: 2-polyprenylphenol 6-hydroxylase [Magnetococcales bacterium]|nr:2-polyprenylphenol 6-hydroxylase [Magnetococcales bacterium]
MLTAFRTLVRLAGIVGTLIRYDLEPISERFFLFRALAFLAGLHPGIWMMRRRYSGPARVRKALEELGPTFIKFGQALSTRMDALPDDVGQELKKLQDEIPPFPFAVVEATIERELGGPVLRFFREFNPTPVASASIAQVHRAVTREGREVAVKVMRPGIEVTIGKDIRLLYSLADGIERFVPEWKRFRVRQVVDEFARTIRNEMNFPVEGARAQRFRSNFQNDPELHIPAVVWPLTSQRVLTMEWVTGVPIDDLSRLGPQVDVTRVSRNIITVFFKQVFRDGYFHADQHPGNIMVQPDGTITILDFGIIGRVDMQTRIWLARLLEGFIKRDYQLVAQVHLDAGYVPLDTNLEEFEEACRLIGEPIFGQPLKEISIARLLGQLFKVTERFDMAVQPQLLLLQKTMITLEGVGREINPNLNMWFLAEPLIREWMIDNLGPKGKLRQARKNLRELADFTGAFPELLQTGLKRLAQDQIHLRIHPESLEPLAREIRVGFGQQTTAISGGVFFLGASLLAATGFSAWFYGPLMVIGGWGLLRGMRRSLP